MKVRVTCIPEDPAALVAFARLVDASGIEGIGVADSPALHGATYPVVQHLLGATVKCVIGPFVTNPVTRHPSVQAADVDAIDTLFPGRLFYGIGTGDSAVTSVGLAAASAAQVADCVETVHARVGGRVPCLVAAGGPRVASAFPRSAAGIVLGGGMSAEWSLELVERAEQSAGHSLQRWGFAVASLGPEGDAAERRREVLGSVTTVARHALAGDMDRKGVPRALIPGLRDIFANYDVTQHGHLDSDNHRLLARHPEHCHYLLDRFAIVETTAPSIERLLEFARRVRLHGIFLSSTVSDRTRHVHHIATDLVPRLAGNDESA